MQGLQNTSDFQAILTEVRRQVALGHYDTADAYLVRAAHYAQNGRAVDTGEKLTAAEREQNHEAYLDTLNQLVSLLITQRNYAQALAYARTLQQRNSRYEAVYRQLIHLYVLSGSRASELEALERRLKATEQGQGALILIQGVAGIGKTSLALISQMWAQTNNAIFAMGRCYERGTTPYLPWQAALTSLHTTSDFDLTRLPEPFGQAAAQTVYQLAQRITASLQTAVASRPLVLLFDDIQWADRDSLALLELVTRNLDQMALVVIATCCSEAVGRGHLLYHLLPTLHRNRPVETIALQALNLADTTRLVEAYHGRCSTALARYLHQRAEGYPLFLVELLSDLKARNYLSQNRHGVWLPPDQSVSVPTLLQQVITQRVAYLGPQGETFLSMAAVVGESWSLAIVESLLEWSEETLLEVLESSLMARIIVVEDERTETYRFAHGLIRESLYRQQLGRRRRQLHAEISTQLENQTPLDLAALAYHFYEAKVWDKACQYNLSAGNLARQRFADYSALQFYQRALDSLLNIAAGAPPERFIDVYELIGKGHAALSQYTQSADTFEQMVEQARAAKDRLAEGRGLFQLTLNRERAYQMTEAAISRQAAMQLAEELADPQLLALNHYSFASQYFLSGQLPLAQHHLDQAEQNARSADDADLLTATLRHRGMIDIWIGRYAHAEQLLLAGQSMAQAKENAYAQISVLIWLGLLQVEQGQYQQAKTTLERGADLARDLPEDQRQRIRLANMLAYLYSELGDLEQAKEYSRQALTALQRDGDYANIETACYALLDIATHHLHASQFAAVDTCIQEFETICERTDFGRFRYMNRYQLLQAELALARGQFEQALAYSEVARAEAEGKGILKNVAKGHLYQGQALLALERPEDAAKSLRQAVDIADQIGHVALQWKIRLRLAEAQLTLGKPNAELYDQALSQVEAISNHLSDDRLRRTFLAMPLIIELKANAHSARDKTPLSSSAAQELETQDHPASSAKPSATDDNPAGLTPREVEVLQLVAQGLTNRQIGETLHISVRTVNTHVTNLLNKIGCDNRTAATAFALQHKLV